MNKMINPLEKTRSDFPELEVMIHGKKLIYLDNAASTLKCAPFIEAVTNHYTKEASNIHRGVHFLSEQGTMKFEETRLEIQNFIQAKHSHEIILTKGTTESINLVAASFGEEFITNGDEILVSTMEHHSNIVPWQIIAQKRGAKVIEVPILDDGSLDLKAYQKILNPKVKLVACSYISNSLGTINPVKEIISLAHVAGAKVIIDAAQAIAHVEINVQELDCDFLAFSAHKMYGPTGVGVLYGKEAILNSMPPYQGGGDMIDIVSFEKTTYNTLPHKFEAGTPNIADVIAFKSALKYIKELGLDNIAKSEDELLKYATSELLKIDGLKIIGTAKNKAAVISFIIDGVHHHDLGTILDQQGIAVRTGHHCTQPLMKRFNITGTTRASFSFYNTFTEIDLLKTGIEKALKML